MCWNGDRSHSSVLAFAHFSFVFFSFVFFFGEPNSALSIRNVVHLAASMIVTENERECRRETHTRKRQSCLIRFEHIHIATTLNKYERQWQKHEGKTAERKERHRWRRRRSLWNRNETTKCRRLFIFAIAIRRQSDRHQNGMRKMRHSILCAPAASCYPLFSYCLTYRYYNTREFCCSNARFAMLFSHCRFFCSSLLRENWKPMRTITDDYTASDCCCFCLSSLLFFLTSPSSVWFIVLLPENRRQIVVVALPVGQVKRWYKNCMCCTAGGYSFSVISTCYCFFTLSLYFCLSFNRMCVAYSSRFVAPRSSLFDCTLFGLILRIEFHFVCELSRFLFDSSLCVYRLWNSTRGRCDDNNKRRTDGFSFWFG